MGGGSDEWPIYAGDDGDDITDQDRIRLKETIAKNVFVSLSLSLCLPDRI
jgi:hypothetical protein